MPKTRALKLEQQILTDLGATPHANSGAMKKKHDGSDSNHLYEIKTTGKRGFSIVKDYWLGLKNKAIQRRIDPVIIVAYDDGKSSASDLDKVVVIEYDYFVQLRDGLNG